MRKSISQILTTLSPQRWDRLFAGLNLFLRSGIGQRMPGDKIHKLSRALPVLTAEQMYFELTSYWNRPEEVVVGGVEPATGVNDLSQGVNIQDFIQRMMYFDMVTYLPNDILVKVDRASMGVSLESRAPFLDHRVVEFAWKLPLAMKIRNGQGKWLLRQVLYKYIPEKLIERPKMGFAVPINTWLRGPLRKWAEALLDEGKIRNEGYLNYEPIRQKWEEHLTGRYNWQHHLWNVLMFQAWIDSRKK